MQAKSEVAKTNIKNTHVPDKMYAYLIQAHHMLYELLDCKKGDFVSVEVFEDVGVEDADGSRKAVQIKSALSDRNPVSDKSTDLWKTMYNWLLAVESGELNIDTVKFCIFINVNKTGAIVSKFAGASTFEEAVSAWEIARRDFFSDDGTIKEMGEGCKDYILYFFDVARKINACGIIQRFSFEKCIENHSETVRNKFESIGIPNDIVDPVYRGVIGWIDTTVAKLVENKLPIIISYEDYQRQLGTLYREYNQKHSLMPYSQKPSEEAIQAELQEQRTYIEQLDIIDCEYTEKVEAINDYLRAAIDRTQWADGGYVSMRSLMAYNAELVRTWNLFKRMVLLEKKEVVPEEQGRLIYYKCQEKEINMDAMSVPQFFKNGCYHSLANSLDIGWHPSYKELIKEKTKNE